MYEPKQKLRKFTALLLVLCMLLVLLPPNNARAETAQPEAEAAAQAAYTESVDINAIPAYQPEGDSKVLNYVHPEVFAAGDHIARLKQEESHSTYAFLNRDGTKTVYYLDEAVKFTAADGSIREKDITLTSVLRGYETTENDIGLHISQNPAAGIRIAYNNKQITLLPSGGSGEGVLSANTVRYENYYGADTALVYTPTLSGVKEEIILSSYTGQNEFVFYINTGGLYLYQTGDRYYLAEGKGSTYRIWLGQIEVFDSNLKPCKGELTAETILAGQRYKLTVTVDEAYLTDPATAYPVTIDPTLTVSDNTHGANAIEDAPIYEGYPTSNFGSYQYNRAGYADATFKRGRTVVRLKGMLNSSAYSAVSAAQLTSVKFYIADASGSSGVYVNLQPRSSNASWSESTVTWNSVTDLANVYTSSAAPSGGNYAAFNITSLAKAWKNGNYSNGQCGFVLIGDSEGTVDKALYASEHATTSKRPYVSVTYSTSSSITLNSTVLMLTEGSSMTIGKTTTPSGIGVEWDSSDESVATVSSSGAVTGIKAGTATITATTELGATAACTVYVTIADGVYWIRNVASQYYLDGGGANIAPENLTNIRQRALISVGNDRLAQMWKLKYLGSGQYSIRPMHKLDMGLNADSGNVDIKEIGTTDTVAGVATNAQWSITYNTNGYVLKSNNSIVRTLAPLYNVVTADATIAATTYSDTATAQRWTLSRVISPPRTILFYHSVTGESIVDPEFHIAAGQTKNLDNWFAIPVVVSGETCSQEFTITAATGGGISVNSTGQFTAAEQQETAERTVTITVTGAGNNGPSNTFRIKVLDASKAIYYDHYYVSGLIESELLAKVETAVSFADHIFYKEFGLSMASSGAPQIHSEITELINGCDPSNLGAGITCTPSSCASACGVHHRSVLNIRTLQEETPRAKNHISVFWANQASGFFCTIDEDTNEHKPESSLGLCPQYEPYIRILRILGNNTEQKEACMGIVLAHETVHALAMKDVYYNRGHDTPGETNCIMEVYEEDILPLHRQFYEAILSGTSAFCGGCEQTIRRDMLTEIFGNL